VRFGRAPDVSLDELLGPAEAKPRKNRKNDRKVMRRLEQIQALPSPQQQTVLKTIDAMLRGLKTAS
jgi:hypothetical protein